MDQLKQNHWVWCFLIFFFCVVVPVPTLNLGMKVCTTWSLNFLMISNHQSREASLYGIQFLSEGRVTSTWLLCTPGHHHIALCVQCWIIFGVTKPIHLPKPKQSLRSIVMGSIFCLKEGLHQLGSCAHQDIIMLHSVVLHRACKPDERRPSLNA